MARTKAITPAGAATLTAAGAALAFWMNHFVSGIEASTLEFYWNIVEGFENSFAHIITSPFAFSASDMAISLTLVGLLGPWAAWIWHMAQAGNYRPGEEHGSARWMTEAELKAFADAKEPENNLILSKTGRMCFQPKAFSLEHDRNKNVLIIGGPGSGKTRYNIKPNLMQLNSSVWVTDPKGTLLPECGQMFVDAGYALKTFNTIEFRNSMHFNPFAYITKDKDIPPLVQCIVSNVKPQDAGKSGDPFWEQTEKELICALVAYMFEALPPEQRTFRTLSKLLAMIKIDEDGASRGKEKKSPLDILFEIWETGLEPSPGERGSMSSEEFDLVRVGEAHPDSYAVSLYKKFKVGAGKTLKSVLMSVHSDLWQFELKEVLEITDYDEMDLDSLGGLVPADLEQAAERDPGVLDPGAGVSYGQRKTAVFVVMDDSDPTFGFLVSVLTFLAFNRIKSYADRKCKGGKLPVPVQFYLDEFANIGKIEAFQQLITTLRSRSIATTLCLQSLYQLDSVYGEKEANIIKDACDTWIYLGGCGNDTCKAISERLGNETITTRNNSKSEGQGRSSSISVQTSQRALMDGAEVGRMPRKRCLVMISGTNPYYGDKYAIEDHTRYALIDPGHKGKKKTLGLFGRSWPAARYDRPFSAEAFKKRLVARRIRAEFEGIAMLGKRKPMSREAHENLLAALTAAAAGRKEQEGERE